ncbi:class I SAM-dependent methyltransferase [Ravibacter arvi]
MLKSVFSWVLRYVPRPFLQRVGHFAARFLGWFHSGNSVECPVCRHSYSKFLPYGRGVSARENVLCPGCLSLERHRLMWLFLKKKTPFFTAKLRVLHVAPEYCFIDRFEALPNLDYVTADLESPLAKVKMDIHRIPFPDNEFDVVFCNHVMEHVEDHVKALSELHRVLKPAGWGIIQSPQDLARAETYEDKSITDPRERERHFLQSDHYRIFGRNYGEELRRGGFRVTEDRFVMEELSAQEVRRYALPGGEIVYFCEK